MTATLSPIGEHVRGWRQRRRLSQLALALDAEISSRHLSFLETGRARPSRDMVLRLADRLGVPLRERNVWLLAAGFAPAFAERSLDDPALDAVRRAVDAILTAHEPFPALAVDRHWTLVRANASVAPLMAGADPLLLQPPVNVLRLSLDPRGLAPRIANLAEWRAHLLARLRRQVSASAEAPLAALLAELEALPMPPDADDGAHSPDPDVIATPLRLRHQDRVLSFLSTTTVFGTPSEITVSELALEAFLPADAGTAQWLRDGGLSAG